MSRRLELEPGAIVPLSPGHDFRVANYSAARLAFAMGLVSRDHYASQMEIDQTWHLDAIVERTFRACRGCGASQRAPSGACAYCQGIP